MQSHETFVILAEKYAMGRQRTNADLYVPLLDMPSYYLHCFMQFAIFVIQAA
jgi:hypothetical protein